MSNNIHKMLLAELELIFKSHYNHVSIPPPVFSNMEGEVIHYDKKKGVMEVSFPIKKDYMNPFGSMQGGMIAAAIDNTFGPLSMLIGPLNYTRQLEIKYRKTIHIEMKNIFVLAKYEKSNKRQLFFSATVLDLNGNELASAKAIHWILKE